VGEMMRVVITVGLICVMGLGAFIYIRNAERAKINNSNTTKTIEGIRDARSIENETRGESDGGLLDYLLGRVRGETVE
jgi:hypothetical protein